MRVRPSYSSRVWRWPLFLCLVVAVICVCLPLRAQLKQMPALKDFKIVDYFSREEMQRGQTNQVKNLFTGAEAQQRPGGLVLVRQMRIDNFRPDGGTNFIVRMPECIFDYVDRTAQSTGRIEVASGDRQFLISGREGFSCRLTNTLIILSNRVRTEIHHNLISLAKP